MSINIQREINLFIRKYSEMNINGIVIHCPYWMNKIKSKVVVIRGFANGKGDASIIKNEIKKRLMELPKESKFPINTISLQKFAKRERIGIDCSGLTFRFLDELIRLKYCNANLNCLTDIFKGGINRTNADTMTSGINILPISNIYLSRLGDLIRINGGKHVAVVVSNINGQIKYLHSHDETEEIGVHTGIIKITDISKPLENQIWVENLKNGENFGQKKFHPELGDGIYRLRVFC